MREQRINYKTINVDLRVMSIQEKGKNNLGRGLKKNNRGNLIEEGNLIRNLINSIMID